jgi:hypothetical protein
MVVTRRKEPGLAPACLKRPIVHRAHIQASAMIAVVGQNFSYDARGSCAAKFQNW